MCRQRLVAPRLVERGPFERDAQPLHAEPPRFDAQAEAGVLLDEIVADVERDLGQLDIACSNAGTADWQPFLEITEESFDRIVAVTRSDTIQLGKQDRPIDVMQARSAQRFAQIIGAMMRDATFKNLRVADLEWLVLPPLIADQCAVGYATRATADGQPEPRGVAMPVAMALWARVSPNVDKLLTENLDTSIRLKASDWKSGDIWWLVATAGDKRVLPQFIKQLREKEFKGRLVKMRVRDADGTVSVKVLGAADA